MIAKQFPDPANPYVLRAAQDGDLFILLVSRNEHPNLFQHQHELQSICGGSIMVPVHVTAQRFEYQGNTCLQELGYELRYNLLDFPPFPIHAVSYRSVYSPYRQRFILKWIAELSKPLQHFSKLVEKTLHSTGHRSLYQAGWISSWITALEDVENARLPFYLDKVEIPSPLFVGSEVIISRVNGQNDFTYLDRFSLNNNT
jgi:hypothetical protein